MNGHTFSAKKKKTSCLYIYLDSWIESLIQIAADKNGDIDGTSIGNYQKVSVSFVVQKQRHQENHGFIVRMISVTSYTHGWLRI